MKQTGILIGIFFGLVILFFIFRKLMKATIQNVQPVSGPAPSTVKLISFFEGRKNKAYKDANGYSIGVGHLIKPGEEYLLTKTLSEDEIDSLLLKDLSEVDEVIKKYIKIPLSRSMYDAVASLIFNIGPGNFSRSTLLKWLNAGKGKEDISSAWKSWNRSQGKELAGLTKRREKEVEQFFS